ncbi:hypothetical protein CVT24_006441, partial [Panaeolus cyanescens]
MPRETWVPEDRIPWLLDRYPAYLKTQRHTRTVFMDNLFRDYISRWPHDEPSEEFMEEFRMKPNPLKNPKKKKGVKQQTPVSIDDSPSVDANMVRCSDQETRERAIARLDELLLKRLKEWFRNHGRVTSKRTNILAASSPVASAGSSKVLFLGGKKTPQSWQAYFSKYRTRLQPLIDKDWQTYREALPTNEKAHWISFFQKWCKEKLAEEGELVKKEVEEYRQTYNEFEDPSESHNEKLIRYQQSQNKIFRTLDSAGEAIEIQTGWSSLIIAGGPEVKAGGEPKIIISCAGEADGKTFAEWLGDVRYGELQKWFADFISEKYGASIESGLWTAKPADDQTETTGSTAGVKDNDTDSEDSDSEIDNDNDQDFAQSKKADYLAPLEQRQEYLREKEASTARTKQLLAQMRDEFHQGLADMRPPILSVDAANVEKTQSKIRKPRANKKQSEPPSRKSDRLHAREAETNLSITSTQASSAASVADHEDDVRPSDKIASAEINTESETQENNNQGGNPRTDRSTEPSAAELSTSSGVLPASTEPGRNDENEM